jgi:hypothetical protein
MIYIIEAQNVKYMSDVDKFKSIQNYIKRKMSIILRKYASAMLTGTKYDPKNINTFIRSYTPKIDIKSINNLQDIDKLVIKDYENWLGNEF